VEDLEIGTEGTGRDQFVLEEVHGNLPARVDEAGAVGGCGRGGAAVRIGEGEETRWVGGGGAEAM
jgi:hypothetical protein